MCLKESIFKKKKKKKVGLRVGLEILKPQKKVPGNHQQKLYKSPFLYFFPAK